MRKNLLILIGMFLILFYSCSKHSNHVKLVDKNFSEEISKTKSLSFTFNKKLVPDSLVNVWLSNEFLIIKPQTQGKYMWTASDKLVFVPAKGFRPSTDYTCKISSEVLNYKPDLKLGKTKTYKFHTTYLNINNVNANWVVSNDIEKQAQIQINIEFNQDVNPTDVAELFRVKINKKAFDFELLTSRVNNIIQFVVSDIENKDDDLDATVILKKGLKAYNGTKKISSDFEEDFLITSSNKLNIDNVRAKHDGNEGTVTVYTTQDIPEDEIKRCLLIEPKIKYTVESYSGFFIIKSSNFSMNRKYDLTLKKGLTGKLGGKLKNEYTQPVSFGNLKPSIAFVNKKEFYLSKEGARNIEAAIVNTPKVNVRITKIYENNIVSYVKNYNFRANNDYYYDDYYYDYSSNNTSDFGDIVFAKKIETNTLPRRGNNHLLNLDFEDKLSDHKGLYVVEIASTENYYLKDKALISISDIGLIVKKGKKSITVFANSIKTAQPLADVDIKFIGKNNQVNATVKTNAEGFATYQYTDLKAPGFETNVITAKLADDFNFIPLKQTRVTTSRYDVGGSYKNASGLETFIYAERDIYRPGETIHFSAIIRNYQWKSPGDLPVIVKVITPNGKKLKTARKILNSNGAFESKVKLAPTASTGTYSIDVYTSNNVFIGSKNIKVEEFMPDRIKVDVRLDYNDYSPSDIIDVDFVATNFFGPPAANRNYQVELSTKRKYFVPKENRDFNYYIQGADKYFERKYREGKTNPEGKGHEMFIIPDSYRNLGLLQSDIFTTVFDETGRPVNRLNKVNIYTQEVFLGIRYDGGYYTATEQAVKFNLIAVDKNGKALDSYKANLKLIKHEYKTVLSKSGKYFRYRSEKVERIIDSKQITLSGVNSTYSFIPETSGTYELRVSLPNAATYVSRNIYAYGWGSTSYSSFKVNNEGQIDIQLDKEKYNVGEKANVILKAPFSGKILVTVESDKVLKHFYVNTDKRVASFELDIPDDYLPNVYLTATLFRPHKKSDMPLTVAHGFTPVIVEKSENRIPIDISAVEKSESNKTQTIHVKAKPNSELTIAVVDEGILQITNYKTPSPYDFFYQRRALQVNSYNIYPYIFPELNMVKSHTGGGDGAGSTKRLNPLQNKRVKLVSFWSGILHTDSKGEAEFDIKIPQFSGDLRIMAVNYDEHQFGSAYTNMKVADPIVVSTALPRFFSPKDSIDVPVIVTNTTSKKAKCKINIETTELVEVLGSKSTMLILEPNSEKETTFRVYAKPKIGQAKLTIRVNALNKKFVNKTDITVRPASPLQKRFTSGSVIAGKSTQIKINTEDFIESSIDKKLIISNSPLVQFTNSLDYLVRYPYGCVEQTVSTAFPQLYFGDLINVTFKNTRAISDAAQNVQAALNKIKLMQLYNGGLTYWPQGGHESWWGSVYAAHFALEAQKAGYDVDPDFLNRLLKYLKMKLRKKETFIYYYNGNKKRHITYKEIAYSLYVLALAGERPIATMNYYKARPELLSLDSKYLLAGAYALTGNIKKYREVLPRSFQGEKSKPSFGGSFYSPVRDEAIALNALLEVDPDNSQIGIMAKHIADYLKNKTYLNTQERSFGFLAMGKIAKAAQTANISAQIKSGGKKIANFENNTITLHTSDLKNNDIEITTKGNGKLYYFFQTEGISAKGNYIQEDKYIRVRKNFYNRLGQKITTNTFKQNDLILVELEIYGLTSSKVENVVISDLLPAGFEIENPRITKLPSSMSWPHSRSHADYMDIRDDRINLFVDVPGANDYTRPAYYYYLVRAVSCGSFQMGPVGADAMYNGEYHSYSGGGVVKIIKKL